MFSLIKELAAIALSNDGSLMVTDDGSVILAGRLAILHRHTDNLVSQDNSQ
jgi:hypothetical protein